MKSLQANIPEHIAVIMDGNGRWAQEKGLARTEGHKEGMQAVRKVVTRAAERGVKALTLYAFSTENWARPVQEVNYIMSLPGKFFDDFMPEIKENDVQVKLTGFPQRIPSSTLKTVRRAVEETKDNQGMILNFAMNYGGRQEIIEACKTIAKRVEAGEIKIEDIDEKVFDSEMLTTKAVYPYQNVDLMIRTSGEVRLSNYLLWHNAYSEFYFTDVYWPDFNGDELDKAILEFQHRQRRYGKV